MEKAHFGVLGIRKPCIANRSLLPLFMEAKQDPREPVLLMAFMIMLHANVCLPTIMFLIYVC